MTNPNTELLPRVLETLDDLKARNVATLDVRDVTSVTDTMVIASGTSGQHAKAISDHLVETMKDQGHEPLGVEGKEAADWILVDLGDVLVHVMSPASREFYDLERLWSMPADTRDSAREES
jgi:ribosome-associated protein